MHPTILKSIAHLTSMHYQKILCCCIYLFFLLSSNIAWSQQTELVYNSTLFDPHIYVKEIGNDYSRINFKNDNGSNYWTIAAYIANGNYKGDRLNFWNGEGGDVMTITGDGEVGIGVGISPKVPFHVGHGRRVLFGIDTLGNGDKLMFLPDLHAFRVGSLGTGATSTYWNRDSIGLYSFASGLNTRAQGFGATAMGRDTEASNSYAMATGYFSNAVGQYSTAMGFSTDAEGYTSTALGFRTDATGSYATSIGYNTRAQALASTAVGRYNVGSGNALGWELSDPIFEIGIGSSNISRANAVTVIKNGNVGIGTTVPQARLHVASGALRIGTFEEFSDGGNFLMQVNSILAPLTNGNRSLGTSSFRWSTIYATNGTINTSDRRDKKDIRELQYGLDEVMQLRPVSFTWKDKALTHMGTKIGLLAQDVKEVISEVVQDREWIQVEGSAEKTEVEAERMGIYYTDLIPVLIKAIQELKKENDQLKARLEVLEQEKIKN